MAQTKLRKKQIIKKTYFASFDDTHTHDYSVLGGGHHSINGGSGNFSVDVELEETSDVLIEFYVSYHNLDSYGAHLFVYQDSTEKFFFANMCYSGQIIQRMFVKFCCTLEDVSAGSYTYEIKAARAGSTGASLTFDGRGLIVSLIDKQ